MNHHYLITDYILQVADDALARLLLGFECVSDHRSASDATAQEPICCIRRTGAEAYHGVESLTPSHPVCHVMGLIRDSSAVIMADEDYKQISVRATNEDGLSEAMLTAVYSRLIYYRTVFVHGALLDVPGFGGLMFIGRSGVGKSTRAELWKRYRGAEIINGDKVFLGLRSDCPNEVMAYGSPWKGSSPYRVNKRVPLRAIVEIKRTPERYIRPLDELEALATYMPAIYMPNWDIRLTEQVMDTMNDMLPLVPIYEMSSGPDESAVTLIEDAIMHKRIVKDAK